MKFAFIAKHSSIWPLSSLMRNDCPAKVAWLCAALLNRP